MNDKISNSSKDNFPITRKRRQLILNHLNTIEEDWHAGEPIPFTDVKGALQNIASFMNMTPEEVKKLLTAKLMTYVSYLLAEGD